MSPIVNSPSGLKSTSSSIRLPSQRLHIADEWRPSIRDIWRTQRSVRAVVDRQANDIAQLPWPCLQRFDDGTRRLREGRLVTAIDRPYPGVSRMWMRRQWITDFLIFGNGYLLVEEIGERLCLIHIPAPLVTPKDASLIAGPQRFTITFESREYTVDARQIIHLAEPGDDKTPWIGVSKLEAARDILAEDFQSVKARTELAQRGLRTGQVITRPQNIAWDRDPAKAAEVRKIFLEDLAAFYDQHAGRPLLLEDGMAMAAAPHVSAADMEMLQVRQLTAAEITTLFGMAAEMGAAIDAKGAMTEALRLAYFQDTIAALAVQVRCAFDAHLLDPDRGWFGAEGLDMSVEPNFRAKLYGSPEKQIEAIGKSTGVPVMTVVEGRDLLGLEPLPDDVVDAFSVPVQPLNIAYGGQFPAGQTRMPGQVVDPLDGRQTATASTSTSMLLAAKDQTQRITSVLEAHRSKIAALLAGGVITSDPDLGIDRIEVDASLAAKLTPLALAVALRAARAEGKASETDLIALAAGLAAGTATGFTGRLLKTARTVLDAAKDPGAVPLDEVRAAVEVSDVALQAEGLAQDARLEGAETGAISAGKTTKTWRVNSSNSRHGALDGETVPIDGVFSNGARRPRARSLATKDRARCQCTLEYGDSE